MTWHPSLAERLPLLAERLGFLNGELRLFLHAPSIGEWRAIRFLDVAAFHDALPRGREVRISEWAEHGSFGWRLGVDAHRSVEISNKGEGGGRLLVLARRVEYRVTGRSEAANWPG